MVEATQFNNYLVIIIKIWVTIIWCDNCKVYITNNFLLENYYNKTFASFYYNNFLVKNVNFFYKKSSM